ncbi:tandem-95 repeat protein [Limoniibacter endophyticus]|nr:tandem-95 repeat protein [Limoniibacter endophyticus]
MAPTHKISVEEDFFASSDRMFSLSASQLLQNDSTTHGQLKIIGVSANENCSVRLVDDRIVVQRKFSDSYATDSDTGSFFYDVVDNKGAKARAKATIKFVAADTDTTPVYLTPGDDVLHAIKGRTAAIEERKLLGNDLAHKSDGAPRIVSIMSEAEGFTIHRKDGIAILTPPADFSGLATFRYETVDRKGLKDVQRIHLTFHDKKEAQMLALFSVDESKAAIKPEIKPEIKLSTSFTVKEEEAMNISPQQLAKQVTGLDLNTVRIAGAKVVSADAFRDMEIAYTADRVQLSRAIELPNEAKASQSDKLELRYILMDGSGKSSEGSYFMNVPKSGSSEVSTEMLFRDLVGFDPYTVKIEKFAASPKLEVEQIGTDLRVAGKTNYNGTVKFDYVLSDGNGQRINGEASVSVLPVNDIPVAVSTFSKTVKEHNGSIQIPVSGLLKHFYDVDGDKLAFGNILNVENGSAKHIQRSAIFQDYIEITPTYGHTGDVTFQFNVREKGKLESETAYSLPATATITVENVNDTPEAKIRRVDHEVFKGKEFTFDPEIKRIFADKDIQYKQSDDALTYSLRDPKSGMAPTNLSINAETGVIEGSLSKSVRLVLLATDKAGATASSELVIHANDAEWERAAVAIFEDAGPEPEQYWSDAGIFQHAFL